MRKLLKIFCLAGLVLVLAGGAVFGVGMIFAKGDLKALSYLKSVEYTYAEKTDNLITSVYIDYEAPADIHVEFSDAAESVSVQYGELRTKRNKLASKLTLSDTDGKLRIVEDTKLVGKLTPFHFSKIKIFVTLPADRTYDLTLDGNTGDIDFKGNGKLNNLILSTDTGDIDTENAVITCEGGMEIDVDTGDVELGTFTTKSLNIESDTGDINLKDGTASEKIELSTDTGDMEIEGLLTAKEIVIETDTGDCETDGGCLDADVIRLEADTGDIEVNLAGLQSDYAIYVDKDTGKCNVSSQEGGERKLFIETDTGDIYVSFAE